VATGCDVVLGTPWVSLCQGPRAGKRRPWPNWYSYRANWCWR